MTFALGGRRLGLDSAIFYKSQQLILQLQPPRQQHRPQLERQRVFGLLCAATNQVNIESNQTEFIDAVEAMFVNSWTNLPIFTKLNLTFLIIASAIGVPANILVLLVTMSGPCKSSLRRVSKFLCCQLAFADLLLLALAPIQFKLELNYGSFNFLSGSLQSFTCKMFHSTKHFCMLFSVFVICASGIVGHVINTII